MKAMNQRPDPNKSTPALTELQAIRNELKSVHEEIAGLRKDLKDKKTFQIADQVAKGVLIAGMFWFVVIAFFQVLGSAIAAGLR